MDAQETRRLLKLAARAAGIDVTRCLQYEDGAFDWPGKAGRWNPRTNDGDSRRLEVALEIDILHRVVGGERVEAIAPGVPPIIEYCTKETRAAATRLAVLRAAATVGEQMENRQS